MHLRVLLAFALMLPLAACAPKQHWDLTNVRGHMPDLHFSLTSDTGKTVTAADFRGKVVLMYFGYTHCPDVCPLTLTHLHMVMQHLGKSADDVRILFISVDPARDTPAVLHPYVQAFDPRVVGLTGPIKSIKALTKRYRVAFNREAPKANGGYDVTHSSGIYIFDRKGKIQLLATSADPVSKITHDVAQLVASKP